MNLEVSNLFVWLVLAVIVGAVVGWRTEVDGPQEPLMTGWFKNAVIALGVGFVVAFIHLLSGRLAFWLETAVMFFAVYLIGCFAGGAARRGRAPVEGAKS